MVLLERRSGIGSWRKGENGREDAYGERKIVETMRGEEGEGEGDEGTDEMDGR